MMKEKIPTILESLETSLTQNEQSDISKINTTQSETELIKTTTFSAHNNDYFIDLQSYFIDNSFSDVIEAEVIDAEATDEELPVDNIDFYQEQEEDSSEILPQSINNDVEITENKITEPLSEEITVQETETVSIQNQEVVNKSKNIISREKINDIKDRTITAVKSIDKKTVINAVDTATVNTIKGYKKVSDKFNQEKKCKEDICQNFIPIKGFIGGMIITSDNRYVRILEILPINFYDKAPRIADNITHNFARLFYSGLITHQFKVVCDKSNPYKLIDFIRNKNKKENDKRVLEQAEDTIELIKQVAENGGLAKRFFIIYEYEGEDGKRSNNIEDIYESMNNTQHQIVQAFNDMGNYVLVPEYRKEALFYSELLYYHFNKRSYRTESLDTRITRLYNDKTIYNQITGEDKDISLSDVCAPKGIDTSHKTYGKMDGSYYTYLTLTEESYIRWVRAGWLDIFTQQDGFELDVFIKRLPKELTDIYMEQKTKFKRVDVRRARTKGNPDKYETLSAELNDDLEIKNMLKSGDSLYNVCCVITIRANSYKELYNKKKIFMRGLKKDDVLFEETYVNIEDYMLMTMPLLMINNSIFNRNAHNLTTSQLECLYMFTAYELYDASGFFLGLNEKNNTIASINQFNTQYYRNANMLILGTSGAGKTFTEMVFGWRMRISGIRVYYILPVKGYEYKKMCDEIGGQYIKLAPSLKNCINFLEVRPEISIDRNSLSEDVIFENTSWRSKTIINATTIISLFLRRDLSNNEDSKLAVALARMYNDFGITDDNESVYIEGTQKLKQMPVPSDLLMYVQNDPEMADITNLLEQFRSGALQNLNHQTNVDLSNPFTVFDVDENDIGERYLPAFLFLATIIVYSICKQNRLLFKAIIFDEVWKALINELSAKQIQQMIKLVRGYGASAILATQDIEDFTSTKFGKAVISNTQIKFFLKMEEAEIREIEKSITLEEEDKERIMGFQRGHGLLVANNDKTEIHIIPSRKELVAFTTDTNILREIANVEDD